uniref:Uncharacterized protein n=1 Tax=Strongyloides stercoralis TaxID=6248 RepID=A0AAF5PFK8_STRER
MLKDKIKPNHLTIIDKIVHIFKNLLFSISRQNILKQKVCPEILLKNNSFDAIVCQKIEGEDFEKVVALIHKNVTAEEICEEEKFFL